MLQGIGVHDHGCCLVLAQTLDEHLQAGAGLCMGEFGRQNKHRLALFGVRFVAIRQRSNQTINTVGIDFLGKLTAVSFYQPNA